ncbi:MAG: metalloregulator ArsR/SmtB family transcription factor [Spirochaetales bacterium]|jgi:rhodanese-related sulfurtransferase|nr:metalloregulator ArsR/SmtB family transcription factor [Spirochaetales bacterium]
MSIWPQSPDGEFKDFVYEQFSRIGKALSSPPRLVILNILCQGEHTVESLSRHADLAVANLSRHLQVLKSVNLVKVRRDGKYTIYSLPDKQTCNFFTAFKEFGFQQLFEIKAALDEISTAPSRANPVDMNELQKLVSEDDVIILDVRPEEEYRQAHLPGAISVPLDELELRVEELPKDKEIVAYCRGRFCILADKAVQFLLDKGFKATRADDGVVEWRNAGFPVEGN